MESLWDWIWCSLKRNLDHSVKAVRVKTMPVNKKIHGDKLLPVSWHHNSVKTGVFEDTA